MNAEPQDLQHTGSPVGFVLPSDNETTKEAIERAIEEQVMQMRSAAFIANLDTRQRVMFPTPCPVS